MRVICSVAHVCCVGVKFSDAMMFLTVFWMELTLRVITSPSFGER